MRVSFVYKFKGSGFKGSGFSAAAGSRSGRFYRKSDPGLAEFYARINNRMPNIEGRRKEFYRYCAVGYFLLFCDSLFNPER